MGRRALLLASVVVVVVGRKYGSNSKRVIVAGCGKEAGFERLTAETMTAASTWARLIRRLIRCMRERGEKQSEVGQDGEGGVGKVIMCVCLVFITRYND